MTNDNKKSETTLFEAMALCQTAEELEKFIYDLCTPAEIEALSERWEIARLLSEEKFSYRRISMLTGASTTTIGRVARFLSQEPHQGYSLVLDRIQKQAS